MTVHENQLGFKLLSRNIYFYKQIGLVFIHNFSIYIADILIDKNDFLKKS